MEAMEAMEAMGAMGAMEAMYRPPLLYRQALRQQLSDNLIYLNNRSRRVSPR